MARKTSSRRRSSPAGDDSGASVRDSAQKIWLAGLGAFERAKTEGPRMFESLVEQGRNMGARAVGAADEALKNMRESGGKWDKLEQVFEDRVSKSLSRLGVLTGREVDSLSKQVADLNETVHNLMRSGAKPAKSGARRAKNPAKRAKAPAKRAAAPRKSKSKSKAKAKASSKSAATRG
jgi:poly(hydroxyalkanoate) granule-associated protein